MSDHSVIPVHCCSECPFLMSFAHQQTGREKHYCGQHPNLSRQEPPEVHNPDGRIPGFCPLRKSPVQVMLVPE